MERTQEWMILGLVGGFLCIVSLVMPWLTFESVSTESGWGLNTLVPAPWLLLFGGILGIAGAGIMLWKKLGGQLLPIGGILACLGWIWNFYKTHELLTSGISIGYGVWCGLLGFLMILVSLVGLRESGGSAR